MQKMLNIPLVTQKTEELGFNQTNISEKLGVSKEAVSQWFGGNNFPRPDKLLRLGQLLDLTYNELVIGAEEIEPIVAFRKVRSAKTTETHIKRAKEMGFALQKLVRYLPFETVTKPSEFNSPKNEYDYVQEAVVVVREKLKLFKLTIDAEDIINCFSRFKTILIPILIGDKKNHENALHIHLPQSATNWVYINLDTKIFDFKFWLVHEIGHIFTPSMEGDPAEDFVDNFAGAFLFPKEIAEKTYFDLTNCVSKSRTAIIFNLAKIHIISPYTILFEINKYAENKGLPIIDMGSQFHAQCSKFVSGYPLVSELLFGNEKPEAKNYIERVEKKFNTIFFILLRKYLTEEKSSPSFIRSVLNVSVADSKEIYLTLSNGIYENTP